MLQLDDYDWAAAGDAAATRAGVAIAAARLRYPASRQHYLSGFVLRPEDREQWRAIMAGSGGAEQRQANWAEARTSYDVGPGVRSEADIATLLAFFRARMGPARAFRLRDPFDADATDEVLGTGDGAARRFALVKHYGAMARRITRPVAGSVTVSVDGAATTRFSVEAGGVVVLDVAPAAGAVVRASFGFDVPVRFAGDRLEVNRATFGAGEAVSVPLIEVREG